LAALLKILGKGDKYSVEITTSRPNRKARGEKRKRGNGQVDEIVDRPTPLKKSLDRYRSNSIQQR